MNIWATGILSVCALHVSIRATKAVRRRRLGFPNRAPMNDEEFVRRANVSGASGATVAAMRHAIAAMCRLRYDQVYDSDSLAVLCSLVQSGLLDAFDPLDFIFRVERELARAVLLNSRHLVPMRIKGPDGKTTYDSVGAWFQKIGPQLEEHLGRTLKKR